MPTTIIISSDEILLITPNNTNICTTIKNWAYWTKTQFQSLISGSLWLASAISITATLNVVSTNINSNKNLNFNQTLATLIKTEVISNAAAALFISFLKKKLTNLGSYHLEKTSLYGLWRQLKNVLFPDFAANEKHSFEGIKANINQIENQTIEHLKIEQRKFQQQLSAVIVIIETFLNNTNNNENLIFWAIIKELIKVLITILAFTAGVVFASFTSIFKNNIANDLPLDFNDLWTTFIAPANIITSFAALIIFKLKFNLIENGLENFKQLSLIKSLKSIINNVYYWFTNYPEFTNEQIAVELERINKLEIKCQEEFGNLIPSLETISKLINLSTPASTMVPVANYSCLQIINKNIKHTIYWLIPTFLSTALDSFFSIITSQISANKATDIVKDLKLLISKNNIIISVIAQFGFSIKSHITDCCWEMFQKSYTYKALSYILNMPIKFYSDSSSNVKPKPVTKNQLQQAFNNLNSLVNKNTKNLQAVNKILNNIIEEYKEQDNIGHCSNEKTAIINNEFSLKIEEINKEQFPPLLQILKDVQNKTSVQTI